MIPTRSGRKEFPVYVLSMYVLKLWIGFELNESAYAGFCLYFVLSKVIGVE